MTNVSGKVDPDFFAELRNVRADVDALQRAFVPNVFQSVQASQLQSGWAIWAGVPPAPAYMLDSMRWVHLRGIVYHPTTAVTYNLPIFTLPPGLRPGTTFRFVTLAGEPSQYGRGEINTAGDVLWLAGQSTASAWFSLDNVHFLAEN